MLRVSLLFIIFCETELSHPRKLCHLGDTGAIWEGRQVGRKHPGLDRVPASHSPHLQSLNSGLAPLVVQKFRRTKARRSNTCPRWDQCTKAPHGWQQEWHMHLDGQEGLPSASYVPSRKPPPEKVEETLLPQFRGKTSKERKEEEQGTGAARWSPVLLQADSRQHHAHL